MILPIAPIDTKPLLQAFGERFLRVLGKDAETQEWALKIRSSAALAFSLAKEVRCLGMHDPVPINAIYQPLRLNGAKSAEDVVLRGVLGYNHSYILYGGPGTGKTTFLRSLYINLQKEPLLVTILFTLRLPGAVKELHDFVDGLVRGRTAGKKGRLFLLVDGYDEVSDEERRAVSHSLTLLNGFNLGAFLLSCRSTYDVLDLQCGRVIEIDPFRAEDSLAFTRSLLRAFGSHTKPEALLAELEAHRLGTFASHPLLLSLVCTIRAETDQALPQTTIGLIDAAIATLTAKWDQSKGVKRGATVELDSHYRIELLNRIAYDQPTADANSIDIERSIVDYLASVRKNGCDARQLLEELAQWYGILVPTRSGHWTFVHRTIQDYLAAKWWHYNVKFAPSSVKAWDYRAVYAACLAEDATDSLVSMLAIKAPIALFSECLYNQVRFNADIIAQALARRVSVTNYMFELFRPETTRTRKRDDKLDKELPFSQKEVTERVLLPGQIAVSWTEAQCLAVARESLLYAIVENAERALDAAPYNCLLFYALRELAFRRGPLTVDRLPRTIAERLVSNDVRTIRFMGATDQFDDTPLGTVIGGISR